MEARRRPRAMPAGLNAARQAQHETVPDANPMPEYLRHAIEEAMVTSDLEVLRNSNRLLQARLATVERELIVYKDRLASADSYLLSIAASKRERRRVGGKDPVDEGPDLPDMVKNEGLAIRRSAHRSALVLFTFFATYIGKHVWDYKEPGWDWDDVNRRFDPHYPLNWKLGRMLEVVSVADEQGLEWIRRGTVAYQEQFEIALAVARSDTIKRLRDNGPEIFRDLKDMINAGFDTYYKTPNAERLTYQRKGENPTVLDGFGPALFFPESCAARGKIPGLGDIVGIWASQDGKFTSKPLDALIIYQSYEVKGGEEFLSDVLFRLCRSVLYGATAMGKKTKLSFDARSRLKGLELGVTPGLIVGTITVARIALSPEEFFTWDGKGPVTKIPFDEDAEEMLEGLMRIWEEPGGQRIREVWQENIFPSMSKPGPKRVVDATVEPRARQRGEAAAEMAARNRQAMSAQAVPAQANALNQEHNDSYHIPRESFYDDPDRSRNFVTSFVPTRDYQEDVEDGAEDNSDAEKEYTLILDEDQGRVLRAPRQTLSNLLPDPSQDDQLLTLDPNEDEPALRTSSPPRLARARNPPALVPARSRPTSAFIVPAASRTTSAALVPARSQQVASRATPNPLPKASTNSLAERRPSSNPSGTVARSVSQAHASHADLLQQDSFNVQPPPGGDPIGPAAPNVDSLTPPTQHGPVNENSGDPQIAGAPTVQAEPIQAPEVARKAPAPRRITRSKAPVAEVSVEDPGAVVVGGNAANVAPAVESSEEASRGGIRGRGRARGRGAAAKRRK